MKATKIKMYSGRDYSNSVLEIDEIYIDDCDAPKFYKKANVYNALVKNPGCIHVDLYPYPKLLPKKSKNNEKYVSSTPNDSTSDNLLRLPRY